MSWTPPDDDSRSARLWAACKRLPQDYTPYGENERWADPDKNYPDCSAGCVFFIPLHVAAGDSPVRPDYEGADLDWGICTNPNSHRCGLLTFEHQGCQAFVQDPDLVRKMRAWLDTAEARTVTRRRIPLMK